MSLAIITLLVLLTLYAIYFYDKCYNNSKKHISLQQYLKQESANNGTNETSQSFSDQEPMLRQIKENGALIFEEHKLRGILDGKYYWELRTNKYKKKGYIGLIIKGSKEVAGVAKIAAYHGPLSKEELKDNKDKHGVLLKQINQSDFKHNIAIELAEIIRFEQPIPYEHKPGAVMWVKIGEQDDVMQALAKTLSND